MNIEIPKLPYAYDALEPVISSRTLELHFDKHHQGYVTKLEKAIAGTPRAERSLEELIRETDGDVFNNAAQVWNHSFYWQSLKPGGGGEPKGELANAIKSGFGSFAAMRDAFHDAATGEFGSGWAWLVLDRDGRLRVASSSDAENPLQKGHTPLLTIDVWEHAYYLDYQNRRAEYVDGVLDRLINWDFAVENVEARS